MATSKRHIASPGSSVVSRFEAVLFDLDGVITPTAEVHQRAWREVFEDVLPKLAEGDEATYGDHDYELYIDGRPRFEGVERLLRAHDVTLEWGDPSDPPGMATVCAIGNMKNRSFNDLLQNETLEPFSGSLALLEHVRSHGLRTAIVSSSANARAVLASAGLNGVFDVVVDGVVIAGRGLAGKPEPDPFLEAARLLETQPDRAVVIEDAIAGVKAGAAGGFGLVVGVARETDPDRLIAAGADLVVGDLGELL